METKLQTGLQYDFIHCFISGCLFYLLLWLEANEWHVNLALQARHFGEICYENWDEINVWPGPQISSPQSWWNYQYLQPSLTGILASENILFTL